MKAEILEILNNGTPSQKRALFQFDFGTDPELILKKFTYWSKWFFPKYFKSKDAPFHKDIDKGNIQVYLHGGQFLNIAFRGSAKTTRTKLFIAFAITNDTSHFRRFYKVLSKDLGNAKQSTTDVYNMLITPRVKVVYPEVFEKTEAKREETMGSFTTATGIKMTADSIGTGQRGDIQDESRPDFLWFDDIETRLTLMSAVDTFKIWQNMDEAYTGLSKDGGAVYTANYLSERGNVHKLVGRVENKLIVPIIKDGIPTWDRYSAEDIEQIKKEVEDFEGDYLCQPSASQDIYFNRSSLDRMEAVTPLREVGGFKVFYDYRPDHAYAIGADVAGGVGLDSSTSVLLDFSTVPARVTGTYHSNTILPEAFGYALYDQANQYGGCLVAPENNKYDQVILVLKQLGAKLFSSQHKVTRIGYKPPSTYGWTTNSLTKTQMLSSLNKAIEDGLIDLSDPDLIEECKSYSRNDLIDTEPDIRMTTRHFDLVIALAIAWQMKDRAVAKPPLEPIDSIWETEEENNPAI